MYKQRDNLVNSSSVVFIKLGQVASGDLPCGGHFETQMLKVQSETELIFYSEHIQAHDNVIMMSFMMFHGDNKAHVLLLVM